MSRNFSLNMPPRPTTDITRWTREWGVDMQLEQRGGLKPPQPEPTSTASLATAAHRRPSRRALEQDHWLGPSRHLKNKQVTMLGGVTYDRFDDQGLQYHRQRSATGAAGQSRCCVCRPGAQPKPGRCVDVSRPTCARHRRRRRSSRIGRQTRHRARHTPCCRTLRKFCKCIIWKVEKEAPPLATRR